MKLKSLSREGVPAALEKAHRYRMLNEPSEAESICLDVLDVEKENQQALVTLILAITDQFGMGMGVSSARELLGRLTSRYDRLYYEGIICERMGKASIRRFRPARMDEAYGWLTQAMELYEEAEKIRPTGNDDAILRWNTCARMAKRYNLQPRREEPVGTQLE